LVGVGAAGTRGYADKAREDGFGQVVEGVFVKEVGAAVGCVVFLEGALVEDLVAIGEGDGEHVAGAAGGSEPGAVFGTGKLAAKVKVAGKQAGVAFDEAGEEGHAEGVAVEVLDAQEFEVGSGLDGGVGVVR